MSATRVHVDVAGSKMFVSTIPCWPVDRPPNPPTTSTRPSGRTVVPEQKMLSGALKVVNVCDAESQRDVGSGCCQPSQTRYLPVSSRTACTATSGQLSTGPHWPPGAGPGVTAFDAEDAGPVPIAF